MKTCERCDGTKKFKGMGFMTEDCPKCKGSGKVIDPKTTDSVLPKIRKKRRNKIPVVYAENGLTGL